MKRSAGILITAIVCLVLVRPAVAADNTCEELRVTAGATRFAPSTVSFSTRTSQPAASYTYYFGDGTSQESNSADVSHKYDVSGSFTVRVDANGGSCQTIFSLLNNPFESQKSGCGNVFILGGNNVPVGTDVKFLVTGYENKSGVRGYSMDFGNGQKKDNDVGTFDFIYTTPGSYTIKGFITDSKNNKKGESGSCSVPIAVGGAPLVVQPETGTPTWITVAGLLSAVILMVFYAQKNYLHKRA
jgi:hypothetical protein